MNLTCLCPAIQESLLFLTQDDVGTRVRLHELQSMAAKLDWSQQKGKNQYLQPQDTMIMPATFTIAANLETIIRVAEPEFLALTEHVVRLRPTPDRWTLKEVLGHLVDSAANNHQRFVRAQFAPTMGFVFPEYGQNEWVRCQNYDEANWNDLVDLWTAYNRQLAHVIRNVSTHKFDIPCLIGDNPPVTLLFLIQDYVDHLKHHLRRIAERLNVPEKRFSG